VIDRLIRTYVSRRSSTDERFIDLVQRIGIEPFKEAVYGTSH
jgi:sulfite reductase (NADPH) hemoprotein beta-component